MVRASATACTATCDPPFRMSITVGPLRPGRTRFTSSSAVRGKRYLMANVPRTALDEVKRVLPGLNGPTVIDILNGGSHVAVHAVADARTIYRTVAELKALGAEGILVTRIERLMA